MLVIFLCGFLSVLLSVTAFAETCPPVIKADSKAFSTLKVSDISAKGQISEKAAPFNLSAHKGKVTVVRLFATWCPYCKRDLQALDAKMSPLIRDKKMDVVLVSFQSRKESAESIELFQTKGADELGVKKGNFKWLYSNTPNAEIKELKSKDGEPLFPGMQGVPYGLVFDQQGRLRFQGHFTGEESVQNKHYEMIESLASGKCS